MVKTDMELLKSMLIKKENMKTNNGFLKMENTTEGLSAKLKSIETQITQKVRKGYNNLPVTTSSSNYAGITITVNKNKSITANGTATENVIVPLNEGVLYPAGTYKLSGCPNGGATDTYRLDLMNVTTNSIDSNKIDIGNGASFTTVEDYTFIPRLRIQSGTTVNNLVFEPMLVSDTSKNKYEPYGSMPSIKFPSSIKHILGTIKSYNLAYVELEGQYRGYGNGTIKVNVEFNSYIAKVQPNTTYNSQFTGDYGIVSNLCFFNSSMTYLSGDTYNGENKTFITPENCSFVTVAVPTYVKDFMIIEGTEEKVYLPYGDIESIYSILYHNKNLAKMRLATVDFSTGEITEGGTSNYVSNKIYVDERTIYFWLNGEAKSMNRFAYDKYGNFIGNVGTHSNYTASNITQFDTNEIEYIILVAGSSIDLSNLLVNYSDSEKDYILHQEEERLLNLSKYNLYNAVIQKEGLDWYILENYAKYVITGEENITGWATTNNSFVAEIADILAPTYANTDIVEMYSECQKVTSRLAIYNATQNEDLISISGNQVFFLSADFSTSADFKAAMIGKEIVYKMDKPIKTLITDEVLIKQLNSMILGIEEYEDITYLNCDKQLILELEVEKDKIKILEQENMNLNQIVLENGGI